MLSGSPEYRTVVNFCFRVVQFVELSSTFACGLSRTWNCRQLSLPGSLEYRTVVNFCFQVLQSAELSSTFAPWWCGRPTTGAAVGRPPVIPCVRSEEKLRQMAKIGHRTTVFLTGGRSPIFPSAERPADHRRGRFLARQNVELSSTCASWFSRV